MIGVKRNLDEGLLNEHEELKNMPTLEGFEKIDAIPQDIPIQDWDQALRRLLEGDRWLLNPYKRTHPTLYNPSPLPEYRAGIEPHPIPNMAKHNPFEDSEDTALRKPTFIDENLAEMDDEGRPLLVNDELSKDVIFEPDPEFIYRGLSSDEMRDIIETGDVRSRGDWNLSGQEELTYFSTDPEQAARYAGSFAPYPYLPSFEHPGYVIKAKRPSEDRLRTDNPPEIGVEGGISADDIVDIMKLQPYSIRGGHIGLLPKRARDEDGNPIDYYNTGTRYSPYPYVGYGREPLDILNRRASVASSMTKLASKLDASGHHELADRVDTINLGQTN